MANDSSHNIIVRTSACEPSGRGRRADSVVDSIVELPKRPGPNYAAFLREQRTLEHARRQDIPRLLQSHHRRQLLAATDERVRYSQAIRPLERLCIPVLTQLQHCIWVAKPTGTSHIGAKLGQVANVLTLDTTKTFNSVQAELRKGYGMSFEQCHRQHRDCVVHMEITICGTPMSKETWASFVKQQLLVFRECDGMRVPLSMVVKFACDGGRRILPYAMAC